MIMAFRDGNDVWHLGHVRIRRDIGNECMPVPNGQHVAQLNRDPEREQSTTDG
jgi:hypothetical protein